ncbi:vWA domain-containing protein [Calycomorphotria hydatis]|uniref:von Willebrand factor type A domain protein n=1 Tax=Calycomorphotria hydatis TaxID=2528027 RepID=A0A517TB24_9PLAN|nr:vWA domain-containing protein [Calycomorphotria hydatis]QDT65560.1 von Willebrand factor type A domain protein [Calycomorphotria hydatis]
MKSDLTDITLVVDRSGSMSQIQSDAEGGVNSFIAEQAKLPGEANLTLVQFDTEYEFIHKGTPIANVPKYRLYPRGATALLDAVGRAINETGERLAKLPEAERPGLVVFVVMTDGHENSSREFTKQQIKDLIERQQNVYNWQFTFLGANQDAFSEAQGMGMHYNAAANFAMDKVHKAFGGTSSKVARMRQAAAKGDAIVNDFTNEEREAMS